MTSFLVRRLLTTVITVICAITMLFIIMQFIPGDFATVMLGPRATPEIIAEIGKRMGLDKPIYVQLLKFIYNVLRGDLGTDVLNFMPVTKLIFLALPHTLILAFSSMLLACIIGIPLGTYSASHRNFLVDKITGLLSISMVTTPSFLVAVLMLLIFSLYLGWFPALGPGEENNILSQLRHLILPMVALAVGWIGYLARITRAAVLEELTEDYIRTARAKGLSEFKVVFKHALRRALIPVISVIGVGFGNLLGGAVLVEIIFHRPGLGTLIYYAIESRNFPVVQGGLIIAVFLYIAANLLADLSYGFLDPRIRSG